jgi:hypothetical protein
MTWTYCLLCETIYGKAFLSEQSWKLSFVGLFFCLIDQDR